MNTIEQILARAAGLSEVKPGQDIRCRVDLAASHDVTAPIAIKQFSDIGIDRVFDPDKVWMVVDHVYPASTENARNNVWLMKDFAKAHHIRLYERGEGVIHQLVSEKANLPEGSLIVIADSHTCTCGGYGVAGIGVGSTELAAAMATGMIDLEVPQVAQVYLTGAFAQNVSGKDLILALAKKYKTDYLCDRGLILTGPGIRGISREERMTVCNMGTEIGSMITLFGTERRETDVWRTDEFNLDGLVPQIACPFSPANVRDVEEVAGIPITQAVVGSCTNGRLNDIEQVVRVLKKQKVHPDVNLLVIPASRSIADEMERRGWGETIRSAGGAVLNPGCGPCFGAHEGLAGERDTVISTTNRNFPGRMGSTKANIYLASPRTAVCSAVAGMITVPAAADEEELL